MPKISDLLHYGAGSLLVLLGVIGEAGVTIPFMTISDPHACLLAGMAALGIGSKVDANAAKIAMGWLLPFVAGAMLLLGSDAYAADLKKAAVAVPPSVNDCTVTDCSGAFIGADVAGIGTSLDVIGGGLNQSLFGAGGIIGAHAEYQLWNGKYFVAPGVFGGLDVNVNNTAVSQNRFLGLAYVKLGIGLSGVFAPPAIAPGTISAQLQGSLLSPYVILGAVPFGHQGWASGAGMAFALSPTWKLNLDYIHIAYKSGAVDTGPGAIVVTQQAANDNLVMIGVSRKISN